MSRHLTLQEIYDQAVNGLAAQEYEKCGSIDTCYYRFGDLKCAIGHTIPDELYEPKFDDGGWSGTQVYQYLGWFYQFGDAINHLQRLHDRSAGPEDLKQKLINFGNDYGLVIPEVLK